MKKYTTRRRFYPHTSRKNRKRATGTRQTTANMGPVKEGLQGMGGALLQSMMGAKRGQ